MTTVQTKAQAEALAPVQFQLRLPKVPSCPPQMFQSEASVYQCEGERTCVTPGLPVLFEEPKAESECFKKKD